MSVLGVIRSRITTAHPDPDVELIDLQCTRVRYALLKVMRLIWRRRPDVVLSTLGHLNLALAMLRPLLPNGVRYIGREASIVSETLSRYTHPQLWGWAYRRFYPRLDVLLSAFGRRTAAQAAVTGAVLSQVQVPPQR